MQCSTGQVYETEGQGPRPKHYGASAASADAEKRRVT